MVDLRGHHPREALVRMLRTETLDDPGRWAYARDLLGVDEARVLGRLRSAPARRDYLGTHLLARITLAEFVHDDAACIGIASGPAGRPVLERPPGNSPVSFSISRADHIVVCAVSAGDPIGVDVESVRGMSPDPDVAPDAMLSPFRTDGRDRLAAWRSMRRSLMLRTLREAIIKATGFDTRLPLERLSLDGPDGWAIPDLDEHAASAHGMWRFAMMRVTSDHVVAVAIRCSSGDMPQIQFGAVEFPTLESRRVPLALTGFGWSDIRDSRPQLWRHVGL